MVSAFEEQDISAILRALELHFSIQLPGLRVVTIPHSGNNAAAVYLDRYCYGWNLNGFFSYERTGCLSPNIANIWVTSRWQQ